MRGSKRSIRTKTSCGMKPALSMASRTSPASPMHDSGLGAARCGESPRPGSTLGAYDSGADDIFPEADEPGEAEADPEDQEEREEDRKVADHSEDGANVRACHLEEGQELERPGEEQEDDDHERVRHAALVRKRRAVYAVHPDGHEDKRGNRDGHGVDRELDAIPEVGPVLLDLDVVAEVLAAHELRVEVLQELLAEVLDGNADEKDREDDHANLRVDPGALELEGDGEGDEDAQVHEVLEEVEERATPGERIPAKLEVVEDELVLQELVHLAVDDLLDDAIHAVDVVSVIYAAAISPRPGSHRGGRPTYLGRRSRSDAASSARSA
eukprot:scaffold48_cov311-Pinguiococcus_pyrenoidosus.AAC.219